MCTVLRTYRFVGEFNVTLIVQECAERENVIVRMEGDVGRGQRCQLVLTAAEWRRLCALKPLDAAVPVPGGVTIETHFIDQIEGGDSLTIGGSRDCERVHVEMWSGSPDSGGEDLSLDLSRQQWDFLTALPVVDEPARSAPREETRSLRVLPFQNCLEP
jgi:hypothetical protein